MALFLLWLALLIAVVVVATSAPGGGGTATMATGIAIEEDVYVAILSDRPMFVGLVSAAESVISSSKQAHRLRLLVLVPSQERNVVETAFKCLLGPVVRAKPRCSKQEPQRSFLGRTWYRSSSRGGARFSVVGFSATRHRRESVVSQKNQRLASPFNYARFYLHRLPSCLLPVSVSRLVYFDADVSVLGDVAEIVDTLPLNDWKVAAVPRPHRDVCKTLINCEDPLVAKELAGSGINVPQEDLLDFNAGVMVYSLPIWRNSTLLKQVEHWIRANRLVPIFKLGTNPPLVLSVRRSGLALLDPSWNCQEFDKSKSYSCADSANVVHYSGAEKPWHFDLEKSKSMKWALPRRAHNCSRELSRLGVKSRRKKRPPVDILANDAGDAGKNAKTTKTRATNPTSFSSDYYSAKITTV